MARSFGPTPFSTRDFSWQVWTAIGVIVVAMLVGVWQLFRPVEPMNIPPLLGVIDAPVPKPTPTPKPTPAPTATPSVLPS